MQARAGSKAVVSKAMKLGSGNRRQGCVPSVLGAAGTARQQQNRSAAQKFRAKGKANESEVRRFSCAQRWCSIHRRLVSLLWRAPRVQADSRRTADVYTQVRSLQWQLIVMTQHVEDLEKADAILSNPFTQKHLVQCAQVMHALEKFGILDTLNWTTWPYLRRLQPGAPHS